MRLEGERALVTGSTSGIGAAIATTFAREGATVCVTGRDTPRGEAVVRRIVASGGQAVFVAAALDADGACERLVADATDQLGGLSVLVNNAAAVGHGDGAAASVSNDVWDAAFLLNVTVPFRLCRAALAPMLKAGHGTIINISTRQAERASKNFTAYIASKSALNGLTRAIAVDYAEHGIRCNTISPGYVVNERRDAHLDDDPERRARYEGMHLTRLGTADDIAHAAVYLAGRESGFVTGINLQLDGGSSIARGTVLG